MNDRSSPSSALGPLWTIGVRALNARAEVSFWRRLGAEVLSEQPVDLNGRMWPISLLRVGDKYMHIGEEMVYDDSLIDPAPGLAHVVYVTDSVARTVEETLSGGGTEVIPATYVEGSFGTRTVAFLRSPGGVFFEAAEIHTDTMGQV